MLSILSPFETGFRSNVKRQEITLQGAQDHRVDRADDAISRNHCNQLQPHGLRNEVVASGLNCKGDHLRRDQVSSSRPNPPTVRLIVEPSMS